MRAALLCASSAEKLFIICKSGKSADFPDLLFHGEGSWRETAFAALLSAKAQRCGGLSTNFQQPEPSQALTRQLPRRGSFCHLPVSTNKAPPERKDFPRPGEDVAQRQKGESGTPSGVTERVRIPATQKGAIALSAKPMCNSPFINSN